MNPLSIFEDLKKKIIWLDIKPGAALNLVELAKQYEVSRNPVTVALTRLEAEEWVERNGSHFVVSALTLERMRDITEIRLMMEVQANIWAMHRISDSGLRQLGVLKDRIKKVDKDLSKKKIVELDVEFHRLIYWGTQNVQLANMLDRLLNHYLRFWLSRPSPIKTEEFFNEVLDMIEALESKDEFGLRAACTTHVKVSLDEIMGFRS
ncbi:MAG: GntR family transcriptional regulator [Deltaproteobacteria bacterium]|jgi:GntR family transcriptional regulator, rspAB operon transcriptional repressor|nr:GntR family transcriptional regulator [Deltaproteobacteria bacterium]MBT4640869.1 GntR family transcriptional regulator [Deltaproteobacteria bacterium]MBT6503186.1 GntR family transcriptional regulator [Deltaproteobacteria bacterium]MBT6612218.1 GntR family transcriptional regulator [Deltaproteobacteria bacterium]MBT7155889.1 GntR family transcriptional regulator [Deltaproteobacteria bacterium]